MKYKLFFGFLTLSILFCSVRASERSNPESDMDLSRFAADFYQKCADESVDQNIIVSPFSVATALGLLSQGAQGNTFEQIAHGLHLEANKTVIADGFLRSHNLLTQNVGQSILSIANQIYVHQVYQIQQTFHDVAVNKFKSGVDNVNFADSSVAAQTINTFVEQKTNNKIKNLFVPGSINADTRFVLVNAIYFKGAWEKKFSTKRTVPGSFYLDEVNNVTVDFMQNTAEYNYGQLNDLNASALELKYAHSNISFVVVLPNSRTGLSALEASLLNYDLSQIKDRMHEMKVSVRLPKFKIEYKIQLTQVLQKLGMSDMFESNANFGALLNPSVPLKVSEAVHKAFIEVNEEGSEAAAATGFGLQSRIARRHQTFNADHPFLYYILDRKTNTVLFNGRYKKSV